MTFLMQIENWPKDRHPDAMYFLNSIRLIGRRCFGEDWVGPESSYSPVKIGIAATLSNEFQRELAAVRVICWHDPSFFATFISEDHRQQRYRLSEEHWALAKELEAIAAAQSAELLKQLDSALDRFANGAVNGAFLTRMRAPNGTLEEIPAAWWNVDARTLRARHALGLIDSNHPMAVEPRGDRPIFVDQIVFERWLETKSNTVTTLKTANKALADRVLDQLSEKITGTTLPGGLAGLKTEFAKEPFNLSASVVASMYPPYATKAQWDRHGRASSPGRNGEIMQKVFRERNRPI